MSITQCGDYVCLLPNELESDATYKRICQRWEDHFQEPFMAFKLMSSVQNPKASLLARFGLTAKTQKNVISFRNLHQASMCKYGALSSFVGNFP